MSESTALAPPLPDAPLRRSDVAALLKIAPNTVSAWADRGLIPQPKRIGRLLFWDGAQLRAALGLTPGRNGGAA